MNEREIRFLQLDETIALQCDQIDSFGGLHGIRDPAGLESAIAVPQASFGGTYLHADIFEMAAAYLFHLTSNHAFLDGNKRIGAAAATVFLGLNGQRFQAPPDDFAEMVLAVARGEMQKPEIAAYLRLHSAPR